MVLICDSQCVWMHPGGRMGLGRAGAGGAARNSGSRLSRGLCSEMRCDVRVREPGGKAEDPVVRCCKAGGLPHLH